ncbi:MAG: NBR1-Ig-like domain-containing protein [Anaerolineales bacterium]
MQTTIRKLPLVIASAAFLGGCASSTSSTPSIAEQPNEAAATATSPSAPTLTATATRQPTETVPPSATFTPLLDYSADGCLRAEFVADITIPDNFEIPPAAPFSKTWRLKNTGDCAWNTHFELVFDHGDRMGAPDSQPLPKEIIAPDDVVNLSVNLVAPDADGTYQGFFKLRAPDGTVFGIGADADTAFWVKIVVNAAADPILPGPAVLIVSSQNLVAGGMTGQAYVDCPAGTVRAGGGFLGDPDRPAVFPISPVFLQPGNGNGWTATYRSRADRSEKLTVYAVCLETAYATSEVVEESAPVMAKASGQVDVECPEGSVVTGGGYSGSADALIHIIESQRSGNGWKVSAWNLESSVTRISVYAVCLRGIGGRAVSVRDDVEIDVHGMGTATAGCTEGIMVGGGWWLSENHMQALSSYPMDGQWVVEAANYTDSSRTFSVKGLCLVL